MCTTPKDRDEACGKLENALTDIGGVAEVLSEMGKHRDGEAAAYLANRLQEHYERAHAAMCLLCGLDGGGAA